MSEADMERWASTGTVPGKQQQPFCFSLVSHVFNPTVYNLSKELLHQDTTAASLHMCALALVLSLLGSVSC